MIKQWLQSKRSKIWRGRTELPSRMKGEKNPFLTDDGNLKPGLLPPEAREGIPITMTLTGRDGDTFKGPALLKSIGSWSASHTWHYGYRRKVTHRPKVHGVREV